ncbi:MAG: EAL domain-containing protein [Ruminococcus sp.]|nr:EAL domain-containing protein [Ruminococcus sp.]
MASKRIKKRKKIFKLKKNRSWLAILLFMLITAVVSAVAFAALTTLAVYTTESKLKDEYEYGRLALDLVDDLDASSESKKYSVLESKLDTFYVVDKNGKIIHQKGENTCAEDSVSYVAIVDTPDEDEDEKKAGNSSELTGLMMYQDTEDSAIGFNDDGTLALSYKKLMPKIKDVLSETGINTDALYSDNVVELPVWIKLDRGDNNGAVFYRAVVSVSISDIIVIMVIVAVIGLMIFIIFIIMLVNAIRNFVNHRRVVKLFFTDLATKGHNWMYFLYKGENLLRKKARFGYAVVDLNFTSYRRFCTCHSLEEGERVVKDIQRLLQKNITRKELCAHVTEGSFALVMLCSDTAAFTDRLKNLMRMASATDGLQGVNFRSGVELVPAVEDAGFFTKRNGIDIEKEFNLASTAEATAEEGTDRCIAFFDEKLVEEQNWIDTVAGMQQLAVRNEEFVVYYQPKYDPRTNELRGAEALIRWNSPTYGLIMPGRFIPLFEKNGFITTIDHYMLTHVARDQRRWLDNGLHCVPVSVNISRAHFIEPDLAEQIRDTVDHEGAPHELIEIELTESAFFDDKQSIVNIIKNLKSYGFTVSMDDFGSGYSSLNSLKDMPLDVLKLDAEFFRGETAGTERGEIVIAEAIRLAKSLDMHTVAEGVEIKEQVDFLAEQGCDMIQGYYFSKPLPRVEYEKRIMPEDSAEQAPAEEQVSFTVDTDSQ